MRLRLSSQHTPRQDSPRDTDLARSSASTALAGKGFHAPSQASPPLVNKWESFRWESGCGRNIEGGHPAEITKDKKDFQIEAVGVTPLNDTRKTRQVGMSLKNGSVRVYVAENKEIKLNSKKGKGKEEGRGEWSVSFVSVYLWDFDAGNWMNPNQTSEIAQFGVEISRYRLIPAKVRVYKAEIIKNDRLRYSCCTVTYYNSSVNVVWPCQYKRGTPCQHRVRSGLSPDLWDEQQCLQDMLADIRGCGFVGLGRGGGGERARLRTSNAFSTGPVELDVFDAFDMSDEFDVRRIRC
ncbi:hypothetical protein FA15DRAFT_660358 [Coprinopsis marcescibilis]|uniref:Uncharacterized protein n=1 Tax=Coprinopsis marcescibilis TaxID=230819 RepID=A0A5C3KFV9_COPMA|nr:hypothetical protein FA15DRAFT_660358 [Coprinopsis marcescibilis]